VTVGLASELGIGGVTEPWVADYHASTATLEGIAGIDAALAPTIERAGERMPLRTELVTTGFFESLRPRLQLGRGLGAPDHRLDSELVVVISDEVWRRHFDRADDIIGSQVELAFTIMTGYPGSPTNNTPEPTYEDVIQSYRIVGVMSPSMRGTFERQGRTALWMAYERVAPAVASPGVARSWNSVGRLADGATLATVQTELDSRYPSERTRELGMMNPFTSTRLTAVEGVVPSPGMLRDGKRQVGLFLAGTVLLAIVAACNASLFLLSRAPGRRRELGIRVSIGATSKRLARQLVSEASLLVVVATALGFLISLWLAVSLRELSVFQDVRWRDLSPLDWRVLGTLIGLTALLGVLVSLAPMLGLRRQGIAAAARTMSTRAGWGQRTAGTAQVCIAAVVSAVATAFVWQLVVFATADRGFSLEDLNVVRIITFRDQALGRPERNALRQHRREAVGALPGVRSVALASQVPGEELRITRAGPEAFPNLELPGGELWRAGFSIDADFPEMLGLQFVHGRAFDPADTNPVIVNETMARTLWGRPDVVGELYRGRDVIVGVLKDVSFGHPSRPIPPMSFVPVDLVYDLLVLSEHTPAELRSLLQQKIDAGELDMEIESVERLEDVWNAQFAADRARIQMSATAALLVVLLAAFGFYGTQRYLVNAGRREYAIRAAIGAGPAALGRLVLSRGLALSLPGIALGSLLAYTAVAWLRGDFVTAEVSSLGVAAVITLAMLVLVLSATWGPSVQARGTAPAPLLREE